MNNEGRTPPEKLYATDGSPFARPTGSMPSQPRSLRGLEKLCKLYGRIKCGDAMMVWDYANEQAVRESLMPEGSEAWKQSERAKWQQYKAALPQASNGEVRGSGSEHSNRKNKL